MICGLKAPRCLTNILPPGNCLHFRVGVFYWVYHAHWIGKEPVGSNEHFTTIPVSFSKPVFSYCGCLASECIGLCTLKAELYWIMHHFGLVCLLNFLDSLSFLPHYHVPVRKMNNTMIKINVSYTVNPEWGIVAYYCIWCMLVTSNKNSGTKSVTISNDMWE